MHSLRITETLRLGLDLNYDLEVIVGRYFRHVRLLKRQFRAVVLRLNSVSNCNCQMYHYLFNEVFLALHRLKCMQNLSEIPVACVKNTLMGISLM